MSNGDVVTRGAMLKQLVDCVCDSFKKPELAMLMRCEFEQRLENIVNADLSVREIVFALTQYFEHRGQLHLFIRAVYLERKQKAEIAGFCQTYAPYLMDEVEDKAAATLARQGFDVASRPEMRAALLRAFKQQQLDARATCDSARRVETYKLLHERFHRIDFRIIRVLEKTASRLGNNGRDEECILELTNYTEEFTDEVTQARRLLQSLPDAHQNLLSVWIHRLEMGSSRLRSVVDDGTDDAGQAIRSLIRPALAQVPPIIHCRLFDETLCIQFKGLLDVLTLLAENGNGNVSALYQGLDGLRRLESRLHELVREHQFWQKVDVEARLIEECITSPANSATWLPDLRFQWPELAPKIQEFCSLRATEDWSRTMAAAIEEINQQLETNIDLQLKVRVNAFLGRVRRRFFDVDSDLRQLCGEMRGAIEQLDELGGS